MTNETTPTGEERGRGPLVLCRWPTGTLRPAPTWDLAGVLDDVARYIRRYVVLSDVQAVACTLWVAHCHAFAAAEATPYLHVTSAAVFTRCGECVEPLSPVGR